jgi:hypothetical protein
MLTVILRRRPMFAAVIPVERSLVSPRPGSRPNSGQSSSLAVAVAAGAGIAAAPAVGVETWAGALLPHAPTSRHAQDASAVRVRWRAPIPDF